VGRRGGGGGGVGGRDGPRRLTRIRLRNDSDMARMRPGYLMDRLGYDMARSPARICGGPDEAESLRPTACACARSARATTRRVGRAVGRRTEPGPRGCPNPSAGPSVGPGDLPGADRAGAAGSAETRRHGWPEVAPRPSLQGRRSAPTGAPTRILCSAEPSARPARAGAGRLRREKRGVDGSAMFAMEA
jgi:hypothetical protein